MKMTLINWLRYQCIYKMDKLELKYKDNKGNIFILSSCPGGYELMTEEIYNSPIKNANKITKLNKDMGFISLEETELYLFRNGFTKWIKNMKKQSLRD